MFKGILYLSPLSRPLSSSIGGGHVVQEKRLSTGATVVSGEWESKAEFFQWYHQYCDTSIEIITDLTPTPWVRKKLEMEFMKVPVATATKVREREDIIQWLQNSSIFRGVGIANSSIKPKHLVVNYLPLDFEKQEVLLGQHKITGTFMVPGVHLLPDESPLTGIIRGTNRHFNLSLPKLFESPIAFTVEETVKRENNHIDVALWYVVVASRRDLRLVGDCYQKIQWFNLYDLNNSEVVEGSTRRVIQNFLNNFS